MNEGEPGVGTVLDGRYRIERLLGRGGIGAVFAARHLQIDEPVALKLLHGELANDPDVMGRFQREAKAARKIKSEHAVKILDVGALESGAPYIVMEFLDGTDLDHIARQGSLSVPVAVDYVLQAMEALAEAHVQGMVHRDLKPANLFVTKRADGTALVKVLDFGISKVAAADGELGFTKTGAAPIGSPLYMAPEQMRSLRDVDARSDIWALGIILYELLAAKPPFTGSSMTELCAAVLQDPTPSLRAVRPDVPPGLEAIVNRCLAKDPGARYADVGALAQSLAAFAPNRTSVERVVGIIREATMTAPTAIMAPIAPPPRPNFVTTSGAWTGPDTTVVTAPPGPSRGLMIAIGSVFALLTVVGIGTAVFIQHTLAARQTPTTKHDKPAEPEEAPPSEPPRPTKPPPEPTVAPIAFRPLPGSYAEPVDLTMATSTPNAQIYYTTTGSEPTEHSATYVGPIRVPPGAMVRARAFAARHEASVETHAMYLPPVKIPGVALKTPVMREIMTASCGSSATPVEIPVDNDGAAISFTAKFEKGDASPFVLIREAATEAGVHVPAHGSATIAVIAKLIPQEPASLIDVADVLELAIGPNGARRSISLHAHALGARLELFGTKSLDYGGVKIGQKAPQFIYVQNTGNILADVIVSTAKPGNFDASLATMQLHPNEMLPISVLFTPTATGPSLGQLYIVPPSGLAYCDKPPAPIELRGTGTK